MTPEAIAFMVNYTSGLICVPMLKARLDALGLPLMVESQENAEAMKTAFTVTVDARWGLAGSGVCVCIGGELGGGVPVINPTGDLQRCSTCGRS